MRNFFKSILLKRNNNPSSVDAPSKTTNLEDFTKVPNSPLPENRIELFSVDAILKSHEDLLSKIGLALGLDKAKQEVLIDSVVKNFIRYVHLLPASESHHHCEPGGLLRHSLEVAFYAVNLSSKYNFGANKGGVHLNKASKAYAYSLFLAGLFHDLGKAFYDIKVLGVNKDTEHNAYSTDIYDFCEKNDEPFYVFRFNKSRIHKFHEVISISYFSRLLTDESLLFLTSNGETKEVYSNMILAMSDKPMTEKDFGIDAVILREVLIKADKLSVRRYLKGSISLFGSDGRALDKDGLFKKIVSHLIDMGEIEVNRIGANVNYLDNGFVLLTVNDDFARKIKTQITELEADLPSSVEGIKEFIGKSKSSIKGADDRAEHKVEVLIDGHNLILKGFLLSIDGLEILLNEKPVEIFQQKVDELLKENPGDGCSENEVNIEEPSANLDAPLSTESFDDRKSTELPINDFAPKKAFEFKINKPVDSLETKANKAPDAQALSPDTDVIEPLIDKQMASFIISHLSESGSSGLNFSEFIKLVRTEFSIGQLPAKNEIEKYAMKKDGKYILKEGLFE